MALKEEEAKVLTAGQDEPPPYPGGYPNQGQPQYGYPPQMLPSGGQQYNQAQMPYIQPGQQIVDTQGGYPQQVIIVRPTPLSNPPNDHLVFNIVMTLCCCWPIGIFAIVKSLECRTAIQSSDRQRAENLSRSAKRLGMWTLGAGIATVIIFAVIVVVTFILVPRHLAAG